jgi:hypothetical protein
VVTDGVNERYSRHTAYWLTWVVVVVVVLVVEVVVMMMMMIIIIIADLIPEEKFSSSLNLTLAFILSYSRE